MSIYEQIMNAKGYYCTACDRYHETVKHRYTVETVGEWDGLTAPTFINDTILCPECGDRYTDDLEEFDPTLWSHLKAYATAKDLCVEYRFPIVDPENDYSTMGYSNTLSADIVEEESDKVRCCIEVLTIEGTPDGLKVELEFC